jgi:hypothetical protein
MKFGADYPTQIFASTDGRVLIAQTVPGESVERQLWMTCDRARLVAEALLECAEKAKRLQAQEG